MATKNLVPRVNNEGSLGVSSRKWANAYFTNGNFDKLLTDELKNISDNELLVAGDNITITYSADNKNYTIASTASGGGGPLSLNDLTDATVTNPSTGHILVYSSDDSTVLKNVALSGDATISSAGILTISDDSIKTAMVNANVITGQTDVEDAIADSDLVLVYDTSASALRKITKANFVSGLDATLNIDGYNALDGTGLHQDDDHFIFSNGGTEKKITFSNLQDAIFAGVTGDASIAAGGALTIASGAVDSSMLAGSIDNSKLTNSSITIGSTAISLGSTVSDIAGLGSLVVDNITIDGNTISSTNTDGHIILDPNGTGNINVSSAKVTNLADPIANTDAATKSYVDSVASGLQPFQEVKAATTQNLAVTATNTTLTALSDGAFTVDSNVSPAFAVGDRILVKDQSTQTQNGIYEITTLGNGSTDFVLTRTSDFNNGLSTASGVFVFVASGDTNGKKGFVCISPDGSDTVGTHSIIWSSFSSAGSFGAGDGISLVGSAFKLDIDNNLSDINTVAKDDVLAIKDESDTGNVTKSTTVGDLLSDMVDDSTIETNTGSGGDGKLRVKDNGITTSKLATISRNRLLGYLSTDTSSGAQEANVTVINVDPSTTDNSEWTSSDDITVPSQLSVKNYVDQEAKSNQIIRTSDIDSEVAETFNLTSSSNTINLTKAYPEYINKVIKINLSGNWPMSTHIDIVLPPLAKIDSSNELLQTTFIKLFESFTINIDSSGITGPTNEYNGNGKRPEIRFKSHSSCGFSQFTSSTTGYVGFGIANKSNFTKEQIYSSDKILDLHCYSQTYDNSGRHHGLFGNNICETNQNISLKSNSGNFVEESQNDKFKFYLKQGEFMYSSGSGSIAGYHYYFDSYKL